MNLAGRSKLKAMNLLLLLILLKSQVMGRLCQTELNGRTPAGVTEGRLVWGKHHTFDEKLGVLCK